MFIPRFLWVCTLALALTATCLAAGARDFTGRCVGVPSGDTLEALMGPRRVTVHLAGVAAPQARQPFGEAARKSLSRLALDREIVVREQLRSARRLSVPVPPGVWAARRGVFPVSTLHLNPGPITPAPMATRLGNTMSIRSAVNVPQNFATGFSLGR